MTASFYERRLAGNGLWTGAKLADVFQNEPAPPYAEASLKNNGCFMVLMVACLLDDIVSDRRLRQSWRRVRANRGAPGIDGVSIHDFGRGLEQNLVALRRQVLEGAYRPPRPRRFPWPKANGGERMLAVPSVGDRVLQTSTALVLDELLDPQMSDASFGYRRGRSVEHAIGQVMTYRLWGSEWVVDGDIQSYFDSIPHDQLLRELGARIECQETIALIACWLRTFGSRDRGIAQGSPLSPLLANLYLDPVDKAIHRRRVRLVRFADDFLLVTRTHDRAVRAKGRMAALLLERGLRLNDRKSRIVSFAEGFEFLGYSFNDRCAVARS